MTSLLSNINLRGVRSGQFDISYIGKELNPMCAMLRLYQLLHLLSRRASMERQNCHMILFSIILGCNVIILGASAFILGAFVIILGVPFVIFC